MKLKRQIAIFISAVMLCLCTACSSNPTAEISSETSDTDNGTALVSAIAEEKPPLVIYHISDNEIEIHFTSKELDTNEMLAFLQNSGNDEYNPAVQLQIEHNNGEIHPYLMVFNDTAELDYIIYDSDEEMETTVDGDTLICNIKHTNIISEFDGVEIWHIDTEQPTSFDGIISDDVPAIVKPAGVLPEEFKRSEYDDEYFTPDTDDFIVITYDIPVELAQPEWHRPYAGNWAFGVFGDEYAKSNVKVTYLLSFDDEKYLGTKVRLEYDSIDDAMVSSLGWGVNLVPTERGMPNEKTEDETLIANFFEERDRAFFGGQAEKTDYSGTYFGHHDQFRYYDFKALDTLPKVEKLIDFKLSDRSTAIPYVPMSSITYSAGKTGTATLIDYAGNHNATTYSSKRTNKAGSSDEALEIVMKLPGDTKNLTPITDDYAYVIEEDIREEEASEYYGYDGVYEQFVYLYSFDENGNTVQWIYRRYHNDYLKDDFNGEEFSESFKKWTFDKEGGAYYIDYLIENGGAMTKEELSMDLQKYGQHEGYYFSKPINY